MSKISEMAPPDLPLTGLEMVPGLQGGDTDANRGIPLLAMGAIPTGAVLLLRVPMLADLSATADADPGAGLLRWNDADPGAATVLYIDDVTTGAADVSAALAAITVGGFLYVQANGTSARRDVWQKWQVTSITDASGYTKVGVSLQASAGAFVGAETVELTIQQPTPSPGVDRNVVTVLASSAGTLPVDASLGDYFKLEPTDNISAWFITNVPAACTLMIEFKQATTPRTLAWPASFKWSGTAPAVSTTTGKFDLLAMTTFDGGATWRCTLGKGFA